MKHLVTQWYPVFIAWHKNDVKGAKCTLSLKAWQMSFPKMAAKTSPTPQAVQQGDLAAPPSRENLIALPWNLGWPLGLTGNPRNFMEEMVYGLWVWARKGWAMVSHNTHLPDVPSQRAFPETQMPCWVETKPRGETVCRPAGQQPEWAQPLGHPS